MMLLRMYEHNLVMVMGGMGHRMAGQDKGARIIDHRSQSMYLDSKRKPQGLSSDQA